MLMATPVYRKNEEDILKANIHTQQNAAQQKETQSALSQIRPVVRNTEKQLEVKTQMIVLSTYDALKQGIPKDSAFRTLFG
jgi:hypothetical protein